MKTLDDIKEEERQSYRKSERQKQIKSLLIELLGFVIVGIIAFLKLI